MENGMYWGRRIGSMGAALGLMLGLLCGMAGAQTPSGLGTVKSVSGTTITMATDKGQEYTVDVSGTPSVLELAPGSTDLKTAHPGELSSIAVGDRVLVTGTAGDAAGKLTARRVIVMKASDLAKQRQQEQMEWMRRGAGGLVTAVDPSAGTITIATGTTTTAQQKTVVHTTPQTVFRRYASDSVKFEDATPGKVADVQVGDQLRVLGNRTGDNIQAEQIISGTFKNIAGKISAVDPAAGTITVKDLGTKKDVVIKVTANSDLRAIPDMVAQRFAQGAGAAGGRAGRGGDAAGGGDAAAGGGFGGQRGGGQRGPGGPGGRRLGGGDLSTMLASFPKATLADLKNGQAVMVTATQSAGSANETAVTVLSGVEPILQAAPTMTLTPGVGGGGGDMGGGGEGGGGFGGGGGGGGL